MSEALRMLREKIAEYGLGDRPSSPPAWMLVVERELLRQAPAPAQKTADIAPPKYDPSRGGEAKVIRYRADFLFGSADGSVEEAGYEFANARTEEYRRMWWAILLERAAYRPASAIV